MQLYRYVVAVVAIAMLPASALATSTAITQCGQAPAQDAHLIADLDCSSFDGAAIRMNRGTLALNGHTVSGNPDRLPNPDSDLDEDGAVVSCDSYRCTLKGPGTVTGGGELLYRNTGAVWGFAHVSDLNVVNNRSNGVGAVRRMERCTVTGNGGIGVASRSRGVISDSVISENGYGIKSWSRRIRLRQTLVTGNSGQGVVNSRGIGLHRSHVTGNATDPDMCAALGGTTACADLVTGNRPPRVGRLSTCTSSAEFFGGEPWGVCDAD